MTGRIALTMAAAGAIVAGPALLDAQRGQGRGNQTPAVRQLAWVDRAGAVLGTIGPEMTSILDPAIKPDGSAVAVRGRMSQGDTDSLYILSGSEARRLTTNEGAERHMIYSPDGTKIAYSIQNSGGVSNLYIRAADGSGGDTALIESEGMHKWYPSWTPDARHLVFHTNDVNTQARDLWAIDTTTGETSVLVDDPGIQALARLSRDGRFVAYQSDHEGDLNIYVTTFPRSDARWRVSPAGGTWPKWSTDELFYWQGNTLMAVSFTTANGFTPAAPRAVFTGATAGMGETNQMNTYNPEYDVAADGQRFVVVQRVGTRD